MLRSCRAWLARRQKYAPGQVYFVTWYLRATQRVLDPFERDLVCRVLHHGNGLRYDLKALVVMDDHVHVIVRTQTVPLERVVDSWKSFAAHELERFHRRSGTIWREGSVSSTILNAGELRQRAEYIVGNPWKRWPFVKGYRWVWWEPEGEPAASTEKL